MSYISKKILKKIYLQRNLESKKYDFGLLTIIGGSLLYSGSPALSAMAAFRAGVDMVKIIAPKRAADIISSFSPNLVAYPLEGRWLDEKHLPTLLEMIEGAKLASHGKTAVLIGGGAGRSEETKKTILAFLEKIDIPVVIDADAIYALSEKLEVMKGKNFVITPHLYEFFILTGKRVEGLSLKEKAKIVQEEASRLKATIVLKGHIDIISNGTKIAFNRTGSPQMTKGGCGDTLAGICGALLARGINPFLAGQGAAFINGKAGELAVRELGESLTATDLVSFIPKALKDK